MDSLYMKVLEMLSNVEIGQEINIEDAFIGHYLTPLPREEDETDIEYLVRISEHPRSEKICDFLKVLSNNGHIIFAPKSVDSNDFTWATRPVNIPTYITKEGLDYYYNRIQQLQNIETLKGQRKNFRHTKTVSIITVLISIITIILGWITYKAINRSDKSELQIQKLKEQLIRLQSEKTNT
jgi:hypothetical protein